MQPRITTLVLAAALLPLLTGCLSHGGWRTASRASASMAPSPAATPEAVLQVYGASAWGWRGWFAIHTWIAAKKTGATDYTVYEVVGWRLRRGLPALRVAADVPDRHWYGATPRLLKDRRGDGVDALIDKVERAVRAYPWPDRYTAFPGPNSNTFTAWVARQVPALELDLPFSAIGSGYGD